MENPRASGARFGLGLDLFFDQTDDVEESASRTRVTLRDPLGGEQTFTRPGDPALDNRKFDRTVRLDGFGAQAPIALPRFRLLSVAGVFPALVLEAAYVQAEVEYEPRTSADPKTTLEGDGLLLGVGLDWVGNLCRRCRWFWGGGYRYRLLPGLDLDRSPRFSDSGFQVLKDEVRLRQDSHLLSARLGYAARGGRYAPYAGLRFETTDLEVKDSLRLVDVRLGEETDLVSRSELDSDRFAGVVGMDVAVRRGYTVRAEATIGGGASLLLKLVGFPGGSPSPPHIPDEVAELLKHGPRLRIARHRVEADGLLRGGWPLVVEYRLPEAGELTMHIEAPGHPAIEWSFEGRAGVDESEMRDLPAELGDELLAGHLSIRARSNAGEEVPFDFRGLGAGQGAVASLALEWHEVSATGGTVSYRFALLNPFNEASAELLLRPPPGQLAPSSMASTPSPFVLPPDQDCLERNAPCEGRWEEVDSGFYDVQIRAWDLRDPNGWLGSLWPRGLRVTR